MGFFGLIAGILTGIPVLLGTTFRTEGGNAIGAGMGSLFGIAFLIGAPLFYGLLGAAVGFIGGHILNFILKLTGGVDFEIEDKVLEDLPKEA